MGSWYNVIGRNPNDFSICQQTCGSRPKEPNMSDYMSPAGSGGSSSIYQRDLTKYNEDLKRYERCMANCASAKVISEEQSTDIKDTRPLELQDGSALTLTGNGSGISKNTILIGVGAIALVAILMLRRK